MKVVLFFAVLVAAVSFPSCGNGDTTSNTPSDVPQITAPAQKDITSVVCYRKYATTQQEDISRFYEIIESAVPIDSPPEFKQGAISYYFDVFTSKDSEYCRSYVINNDILMEDQTNGTYKYYQLDKKNKDYTFLAESCKD